LKGSYLKGKLEFQFFVALNSCPEVAKERLEATILDKMDEKLRPPLPPFQ